MADLFDNPMGLMGFEFVEFASPVPNQLESLFEKMGFSLVARHRSKDVLPEVVPLLFAPTVVALKTGHTVGQAVAHQLTERIVLRIKVRC